VIEFIPSGINGCYEIDINILNDPRGRFVKVFHADEFKKNGLETEFLEEYYSVSHKRVIRGLHFQAPPDDHVKMVYCVQGEVFDVVLDLRVGSPTYNEIRTFNLSAAKGNAIYIPKGLAHGFCVLSESATLIYKVSTVYSQQFDMGIHWSSAGVNWPISNPILSDRDLSFKRLTEFQSPFVYE
jgi:dTDP-4-dehydrorhamnose 3,5-epimerase